MDELISKAKELTKGTDQYGLVFDMVEPFFIIPYLGGYGGKVFDESGKPTLDTPAMKQLVQLVYDFKYTNKITPKEGNTDVANGLFNEGKAAMIINGPWFYSQAKTAGIDFGIANIPQLTGGGMPAPYTGAKVFMVNPNLKDENRKKAVVKFLEYMNTKEVQLKLAKMSSEVPTNLEAQKDSYVTADPYVKALNDQMKFGTPMPYQPEMRCVWDAMKNNMQKVLSGQLKPEDAPAAMQTEVLKMIKDAFGKTY
jgi:maltose-binding protein MalE